MKTFFTLTIILLLFSCQTSVESSDSDQNSTELLGENNLAHRWSELIITATANDTDKFKPRPTISSRFLALIFTSMFDAWSRYDENAIPLYLAETERRPSAERTLSNKEIAISYAAYGTVCEYFYSDKELFDAFMIELGLDPKDNSIDPSTPIGIGNLAAKTVINARKGDGANQYGEEQGSNGKTYFDYTNYSPVNTADKMIDQNRWQPKYFSDGQGGFFAPGCLTPHWNCVVPIALKSSDQFRPGPPPRIDSEQLKKEVAEVVDMQGKLTNEQKALVEFMRDGPSSVQQAGHWLKFAQEVSKRDKHTLDQDIKLFFVNQVAAMDAFIACWDSKMYYDYARPFALVHLYYKDKDIRGWGGPDKGMITMKGQHWRPYSPDTFLCPPFPSYTSGHSTVSGACAEVLKLYTGSDHFGISVDLVPGSLTESNNLGEMVTLQFPTFTETAEMAGISRVLGGYHIQADNIEGLRLGRNVAHEVFRFYQSHLGKK